MRAVVAAIEGGELEAEARLVVTNRAAAPALDFAREHGVAALCIPTLPDPDAADAALARALQEAGVELVVLSGYLRKLGPATLAAFRNRILNIHPALLPKFGGEGMYGRRVHEAVAAAGEVVSGASVHVVDAEYDRGPVIATCEVRLAPGDDAGAIERKVTAAEPQLFVEVLRRIERGELTLP
ncbi:MAG: phosphoribosylglycinamide formyltransferase [Caulobacteraceae bacterium]|nr:phosphoribosylglycinamide formyltransferase [Caulobacteraceae bacterium]